MQPSPHSPAPHTLSEILGRSFSDQLQALLDEAGATDLLRVQLSLCSPTGNSEQCEKLRSVVVSIVINLRIDTIHELIQQGLYRPCKRLSGKRAWADAGVIVW